MADGSESEFESEASGVDSPKSLTDSDDDEQEILPTEPPLPEPKKQTKSKGTFECDKVCATPWGLKWHVAAKHKEG